MLTPMSHNMRERVNEAIRWKAAKVELTAEYRDQGPTNEWMGSKGATISAAYTPWGVACIEAAFLDRMQIATVWDSKDLIRRDILTNPHLHTSIKERLLDAYEKADWAHWHDGWFAKRIMSGDTLEGLGDEIRLCPYLTPAMRDNLLLNLKLAWEDEATH